MNTKTQEQAYRTRIKPVGRRIGPDYQEAWKRFEHLGAKLRTFWKTKKTTLQILKDERTR